jgi:(p)ppGpp synthase/HD superfamily hydrolase
MSPVYWTRYLLALRFASAIHKNDRYGDDPYVYHCVRVASRFVDPETRIVALLHDTLEDAGQFARITVRELMWHQFGPHVAEAVRLLTRDPRETYSAYIDGIAYQAPIDVLAVKMADVEDNLRHIVADQQAGRNPEKWGLLGRYTLTWRVLAKARRNRIRQAAYLEHPERLLTMIAMRGNEC